MPKAAGAPAFPIGLLRWGALALALLSLGSAFAPLKDSFLRGIHLGLAVLGILEAGMALGRGRRAAFFVYAAIAILANPLRPFSFAVQTWRILHTGIGLWLAADNFPRGD